MEGSPRPPTPISPSPPREEDDEVAGATVAPEAAVATVAPVAEVESAAATSNAAEAPAANDPAVASAAPTATSSAPNAATLSAMNSPTARATTTPEALRRSPRLSARAPTSPPANPRASAPSSPAPLGQSPREPLSSPARPISANEIVSPRRSPRIAEKRSSISFRGLLRGDYDVDSNVTSASSASSASRATSDGRRQSSRPATVAARSQVDMSRYERLFDTGFDSSDEPDDAAKSHEQDDDVYMEEDGDGSEDVAGSTTTTTSRKSRQSSARNKRKRKATHRSRHTQSDDEEVEDQWTDASASTSSSHSVSVMVPEPQRFHVDWKAWEAYFKVYCAMTHQKIVIEETKHRQWRIDRILDSKVYRDLAAEHREHEVPMPPEELEIFKRTYVCTHGGNSRKTRGKKERVRRHLRNCGCLFRFNVQVVQVEDKSWCLEVRLGFYEHNHPVSREVFRTYPEERGVQDPTTALRVETLIGARARRSEIYDFLLSQGENVIKRDVDNMIAKHRTRVTTADDNDETAILLAEFAADDRNNLVTIDESHRGHSGVISITTALMRASYARFPELVLVDCTHKTNRYNYQLCTFMVINENGEGAVVQHSLFETNSDWHMEAALAHFVRAHPSAESSLRVVMVDKDLNEIRVLRARFPDARVLICTFHVVKYFSVAVKKPEFGTISPEDRLAVENLLKNLLRASSPEAYEQEHRSLKLLCERVHFSEFYDYFVRNWHSCQPMWVMYHRAKLPYFRVNTNNHLESFFGKIKDSVSPDMSMSECLRALIAKERARQNELNYVANRVGSNINRVYDDELSTVLRFTTHFIADNIAKEYDIGRSKADDYTFDENDDLIKVRGVKYVRDVNKRTWACTCDFASTMELPCRHSVAARVHLGLRPLIVLDRIGQRWTRCPSHILPVRQFKYNSFEARESETRRLSARERFHEAMRQLQPLASEISEISDTDEFREALKFVQDAWINARMCKRVKVHAAQPDASMKTSNEAEETAEAEDSTQQGTGFSLTQNSLYSDEIGSVAIMDTASMKLPKPVSELAVSQTHEDERDNDDEEQDIDDEDDDDFEKPLPKRPVPNFNINLNPRASRPGRPKSSRTADDAEERQRRRVFNDTLTARRTVGEVTMKALLDSLDDEKPGLAELKRRLDTITVQHLDHERGKVEFVKKPRSTMVGDAFYTLPRVVLEKCFKVLPLGNDAEDAISLCSQNYSQEASDPSAVVEGVKIGSGRKTLFYARVTIELMQRVNLLKDAADDGLALVRWLERDVASAVPSAQQQEVRELAQQVSDRYPAGMMDGFDSDFHYGILPLLKPPAWFNDAVIQAFCERLSQAWPSFKATRVLQLDDPHKKRTRSSPISPYKFSPEIEDEIKSFDADERVNLLGIPIDFDNQHWCCMVVDKARQLISTYDSMGGNKTQSIMSILAEKVETLVPETTFTVQRVDSPVQSDGYSCGFFVSYKFWRHADATVSRDLSAPGQLSLRFQMLKMIVQGHASREDQK